MENQSIYVCPNCNQRYSHPNGNSICYCPNCHCELVPSDREGRNSPIPRRTRTSKPYSTSPEMFDIPTSKEGSSFGWIYGLKFFAWFGFFVIVVGGVIAAVPLFNSSDATFQISGFLTFVAFICGGFLFVSVMMVLLGMAFDLKTIRLSLERIHRNQ